MAAREGKTEGCFPGEISPPAGYNRLYVKATGAEIRFRLFRCVGVSEQTHIIHTPGDIEYILISDNPKEHDGHDDEKAGLCLVSGVPVEKKWYKPGSLPSQ